MISLPGRDERGFRSEFRVADGQQFLQKRNPKRHLAPVEEALQ
jgi:hypothetical protein